MILDSNDDDSEESDSFSIVGEDVDIYLNHYRIPKLKNFGPNGANSSPKSNGNREQVKYNNEGKIMSLAELAAQKVACHLPFGQVEHFDPPVPEPMQCRIAFWSFPQDEEDVRLYTCLANGNADVFIRAEDLISLNCVCDMLQVGFHLSANVKSIQDSTDDPDCFRVAITFDRRRITSCCCSCSAPTFWCQHAVAVCLQRIRRPQDVTLRAPVSESLQRLEKNQLQKFAQYLINELPQQILPAAQKLLDELLSGDEAVINQNPAAPDPTAGATINEQTSWCLDDTHLSTNIQKILLKQCTAQPTVCSDVAALHICVPPAANEYSQLLRPIRGREPEGLWNLISIVGEMMKRRDSNFFLLLEIMTQEVLRCDKVVTWWFETKVSLHSGSTIHYSTTKSNSQCTSQYSCSNFCDEIVHLWQLAAMDPSASAVERKRLYQKFFDWHLNILKRHSALPEGSVNNLAKSNKRNFLDLFPGFKPAMEGCLIDWSDWDEKQGRLVTVDEEPETEKAKTSKSAKKRKKKSKASKQTTVEQKPSSSSDQSAENEHQLKLDQDNSQENIENKVETEKENFKTDSEDVASSEPQRNEGAAEVNQNVDLPEPLHERSNNQELNVGAEPEIPRIEQDLQVYYMERRAESPQRVEKQESLEDFIKINIKRLNDPLEILYAKTKGLHAHGHLDEARRLALKAAAEILNYPNYPTLKQLYIIPRRRKKKGSLDNQMSIVASEALTKIAFLCSVLLDDIGNNHLVFRLILFGVEMKRSPAATKPLEVKLINQKHDLIMLLKSIALHEDELMILREKAQAIRDGTSEFSSDALTVLILGNYIFEALVLSKSPSCSNYNPRSGIENTRSGSTNSYSQSLQYQLEEHYMQPGDINQQPNSHSCDRPVLVVHDKLPLDASLGFHVALTALSVKVHLLEVDHPLLCEGTRRQRGELALSLLIHYKDDQEKLDSILKHLLDKDVVLSPQTPEASERPPKKNSSPQDPNHPTEASAHFMFELAKTVLDKAGGNSLTSHLFRPQLISQNAGRGIHRRLHMCTLRIALYALGLQNRTSLNWMQRTYNGRASFIHEQALEIGLPAIKFLCENWEGYLTPVEVACIADKVGSCPNSDIETKRVAAEMAKSCLKYASYLDFNAVRRILAQCKEQNIEMIEEACNEIEQVAQTDSVCADVLFATARAWYNLYEKLVLDENHCDNNCCHLKDNSKTEQDTGASDWLVTSNSLHDKCSQFYEPPIHHMHWSVYGRVEYIPTMYTPTYKHVMYLEAAYRVGMKAMEALKPLNHIASKHSPKKEDDVFWLLGLSKSLGRDFLFNFSRSAINNITNPHVLHIISSDLIMFFGAIQDDHPDRVDTLLPLIHKCLDRFVRQTRDLMKHNPYDQKSYVESTIESAQNLTEAAHTLSALDHFNELLSIVDNRRTKRFKNYIDTQKRHDFSDKLFVTIKQCECTKCKIGRVKYLTCNREL